MDRLQVKVDAAKSRLKRAQLDLTSVLNLLGDLPPTLKTGVMRAIETAFEDLGEAEKHVLEVNEIVRARASGLEGVAASNRCPLCSRPYEGVTPSAKGGDANSTPQT